MCAVALAANATSRLVEKSMLMFGKSDVRSRYSRLDIARPAERRKECDCCGCLKFADQVILDIEEECC
jgi:hypothetical protein